MRWAKKMALGKLRRSDYRNIFGHIKSALPTLDPPLVDVARGRGYRGLSGRNRWSYYIACVLHCPKCDASDAKQGLGSWIDEYVRQATLLASFSGPRTDNLLPGRGRGSWWRIDLPGPAAEHPVACLPVCSRATYDNGDILIQKICCWRQTVICPARSVRGRSKAFRSLGKAKRDEDARSFPTGYWAEFPGH